MSGFGFRQIFCTFHASVAWSEVETQARNNPRSTTDFLPQLRRRPSSSSRWHCPILTQALVYLVMADILSWQHCRKTAETRGTWPFPLAFNEHQSAYPPTELRCFTRLPSPMAAQVPFSWFQDRLSARSIGLLRPETWRRKLLACEHTRTCLTGQLCDPYIVQRCDRYLICNWYDE